MQENRMGYESVPKLILKMSFPMMVSMLIQALYNIVDSIFVAQVSENALTAVSLAYPFQLLIIAVGVGTAIGVNSLMSRKLGEQRPDEASKAAVNGLFLSLLGSIFFLLFGLFLTGPVMDLFLPSEALAGTAEYLAQVESVELAKTYLSICMIFSFGIIFQLMFERIIMSTGNTVRPMIIQIVGAVINIIGDPILIFGWFGLPAMGVAGAAVATVAGQIIAMIVSIIFAFRKDSVIKLKLRGFRPSGSSIKQIYKVGISSILMQSLGSVITFCLNAILMAFSSTAVAVLGIYFKIQSFIFMPVFGMNAGVLPIFGYNFGAGKKERIKQTYRTCILYALVLMAIGVAIFQLFPEF
ncbi:MAG: MATE family efflux transporter, partial [Clostridia bacterium]|nr:MATE family efflux transporter [Clostridia bacterium]